MRKHYVLVAERAAHRCEYCRAPEAIFNLPFEVDHIVPTSRGGTDEASNLALACRSCNLYKSDQQGGVAETTGESVRLFHPRLDRWDEHYRLESDTGMIVGTTPPGPLHLFRTLLNRPPLPSPWARFARTPTRPERT